MFALLWVTWMGCVDSDRGKTIVYALEGPQEVQLDRNTCGTQVGLDLELPMEDALSYEVALNGANAALGTCLLDGSFPTSCGIFEPPILLTIDDGEALVGESEFRVTGSSGCEGVFLDTAWRIELDAEGGMVTTVESTYRLENTAACEDFESDIIDNSFNGRGITGCELTHTFVGQLTARCDVDFDGFLDCDPPEE